MRTWKRLKCFLWHRDPFDRHWLSITGPTHLEKRVEHTSYSCNRCGQVWIVPTWALGPQRMKHAE